MLTGNLKYILIGFAVGYFVAPQAVAFISSKLPSSQPE